MTLQVRKFPVTDNASDEFASDENASEENVSNGKCK